MRKKFTCYRCGKYVEAEMDDDGDATCPACENVIDLEPERKLQNRISTLEAENTSLRERTRWIPVGERLPDVYRDEENRELIPFLVCVHEEGYPFRAVYDGKGWGDGAFKIYPTYWMPLPEAPKEDE